MIYSNTGGTTSPLGISVKGGHRQAHNSTAVTQSMDFVWIAMILIVCRPRKQWPPYFTLSVHEMRNADGRGNNNNGDIPIHEAAPLLVGLISD